MQTESLYQTKLAQCPQGGKVKGDSLINFVSFGKGLLNIAVEDALLRQELISTFACLPLTKSYVFPSPLKVLGTGQNYELYLDNKKLAENLGFSEIIATLDSKFETLIRSLASQQVCALHSCGLGCQDKAVSLIGESGCGKTTLGLAAACAGAYLMGDEFGFLDLKNGLYCHAEYPLFLKKGTRKVLEQDLKRPRLLPQGTNMVSSWGISSEIVPINTARSKFGKKDDYLAKENLGGTLGVSRKIHALVFPRRHSSFRQAKFRRISISELEFFLMPSVTSPEPRSNLFSKIVRIIANTNAELLSIEYERASQAAEALIKRFGANSKKDDQLAVKYQGEKAYGLPIISKI